MDGLGSASVSGAVAGVRARLGDVDYLDLVEAMQELIGMLLSARNTDLLRSVSPEMSRVIRALVDEVELSRAAGDSILGRISVYEACGDLLFSVTELGGAQTFYRRALEELGQLSKFEMVQLDEEPTRWGWDANADRLQAAIGDRAWRDAVRAGGRTDSIAEARLGLKQRVADLLPRANDR